MGPLQIIKVGPLLVDKPTQRLNLEVLAALCDILEVTPAELVEPYRASRKTRRDTDRSARPTPRRARIVPDNGG